MHCSKFVSDNETRIALQVDSCRRVTCLPAFPRSRSTRKAWAFRRRGSRYFYIPFHSHLANVLPVPTVRSKVRRRGSRRRRSQNAHSMTLAVKGVVKLFRMVKREKELHREILTFSVSHDHRTVRIYGHYPVIDGEKTTFCRHAAPTFDLSALDRWQGKVDGIQIHQECLRYMDADSTEKNLFSYRWLAVGF